MTGRLGSSLNFTWTFTGNLKLANWGTKRSIDDEIDDLLVSLSIRGLESVNVPPLYDGRVTGSWDGKTNPGRVVYTLTSLQKEDNKIFVCKITPVDLLARALYDTFQLIVIGKCHYTVYMCTFIASEQTP